MLKNYGNKYSSYGGYAMQHKVGPDLRDVDERLNRLERLVRANILDPAEVKVGVTLNDACTKVEKAAKTVKEFAAEAKLTFPTTKVGLRQKVADLTDANQNLAGKARELALENFKIRAELDDLRATLAEAKDKYWKEKLGRSRERRELHEKVRQFAKETIGE